MKCWEACVECNLEGLLLQFREQFFMYEIKKKSEQCYRKYQSYFYSLFYQHSQIMSVTYLMAHNCTYIKLCLVRPSCSGTRNTPVLCDNIHQKLSYSRRTDVALPLKSPLQMICFFHSFFLLLVMKGVPFDFKCSPHYTSSYKRLLTMEDGMMR